MAAEEEDDGGGIPEWVVTFGDMMSLLLTFFIMLVSLSEIKEEEKFQAMIESIKRQLGHTSSMDSMTPGPVRPRNTEIQQVSNMGRAKRLDLLQGGDRVKAPQGDHSKVRIIEHGTRSATGFNLEFAFGSDQLAPEQTAIIDGAVDNFLGKPQLIEIRGHTSRRPLEAGQPFPDHLALAYSRCRETMRYLVEQKQIDPERIRIYVAGAYEPRVNDAELLDLNERVSVFLLDKSVGSPTGRE